MMLLLHFPPPPSSLFFLSPPSSLFFLSPPPSSLFLSPPPSGLGWNEDISLETLEGASLLHWNGKSRSPLTLSTPSHSDVLPALPSPLSPSGKPWLPDGLYHELWLLHHPPACSGYGRCVRVQSGGYQCQCVEGYSGHTCQETAR